MQISGPQLNTCMEVNELAFKIYPCIQVNSVLGGTEQLVFRKTVVFR